MGDNVSEKDLRNANLGILAAALIAGGGVVIFRNSGEAALQLVGAVAFISAFAVYFTLQGREDRREKKNLQ
jgi:predicted MFS family arabinose efflux permease